MAEEHAMVLRWSGHASQAAAFLNVATEHGATVSEESKGEETQLEFAMTSSDLQELRDRVDALLVAFTTIEDSLS
jgi:hypothetical protein